MELDDVSSPSGVKLEPMEHDQQEGFKLEDNITIENTILMKNEPDQDGGTSDSGFKADATQVELVSCSSDDEEMFVKKCIHHPDKFCYVCGIYMNQYRTAKNKEGGSISIASRPSFHQAYSGYFGLEIRDQHEPWVPHYVCQSCYWMLHKWDRGTSKGLPFGAPRLWSKPSDHDQDCYFCLTKISKGKKANIYPDIPSSKPPDYCKVAPGRKRSRHSVKLPMGSGDSSNNPNGIKLEAIEQDTAKEEPSQVEQDCRNSPRDDRKPKDDPENPTTNCKQRPDKFCYICGCYILSKARYPMNDPSLWRLYVVYFEVDVDVPVHPWEPQFSCINCNKSLRDWKNRKGDGLPFGAPRMWSKPSDNHSMDCYFCVVPVHSGRQLTFDIDIPSSRAPDYSIKAPGKITNLQAYDACVLKDVKQESDDSDGEAKGQFANCKRQPDEFCFICGRFIFKPKHILSKCPKLWTAYKEYFQLEVDPPVHSWEPRFTCTYCNRILYGWYRGEKLFFKFAVPRRWKEPTDHATDCYFCLVDNGGPIRSWSYPDLPSSRTPVPVDEDHPKRQRRAVVKEEI